MKYALFFKVAGSLSNLNASPNLAPKNPSDLNEHSILYFTTGCVFLEPAST